MDVTIINPYMSATVNLFETMFRISADPGKSDTGGSSRGYSASPTTTMGMIAEMVNIIAGNASSSIVRTLEISPPRGCAWAKSLPFLAESHTRGCDSICHTTWSP